VATASAHLEGQEGWLFRATVGHSLAMAVIIGVITILMAYVLPGLAR
jgi:lactate permease